MEEEKRKVESGKNIAKVKASANRRVKNNQPNKSAAKAKPKQKAKGQK